VVGAHAISEHRLRALQRVHRGGVVAERG
jgi:hypothetical protein